MRLNRKVGVYHPECEFNKFHCLPACNCATLAAPHRTSPGKVRISFTLLSTATPPPQNPQLLRHRTRNSSATRLGSWPFTPKSFIYHRYGIKVFEQYIKVAFFFQCTDFLPVSVQNLARRVIKRHWTQRGRGHSS